MQQFENLGLVEEAEPTEEQIQASYEARAEAEPLERWEAQKIASEWHDGQGSALYSFASTSELGHFSLLAFELEINACLRSGLSHGGREDMSLRELLVFIRQNHPSNQNEKFILLDPFEKFLQNFEGEFQTVTTVKGMLFQIREYIRMNTLEQ